MSVSSQIKNIIFDLGGVLLDIDANLMINAFKKLGLPDLIKKGGWDYHHDIFLQMELGNVSDEEFRNEIRSMLPNAVTDEEIDQAWCAIIIGFQKEKAELLQQLGEKYNLYLFSNTNSIHVIRIEQVFRETFGYEMQSLFKKCYYSSDIHLRKPSKESFQYVLKDANIKAEESLFIDDSADNINGAKPVGLNTYLMTPDINLLDVFADYL